MIDYNVFTADVMTIIKLTDGSRIVRNNQLLRSGVRTFGEEVMKNTIVLTQLFQPGATKETYDHAVFHRAVSAMKGMLASDRVEAMVVVTNTESGHRLAEIVDDEGIAPTVQAVQEVFGNDPRVMAVQCQDWGPNTCSAGALSHACKAVGYLASDYVMAWSSDFSAGASHLERALCLMESHDLDVVGCFREGWYHSVQGHVPQNNFSVYNRTVLESSGFFPLVCDGRGGERIEVSEYGQVPLAGMTVFYFLLQRLLSRGMVHWGMVGCSDPVPWDASFEPGSDRERQHHIKIARQYAVMQAYLKKIHNATSDSEQRRLLQDVFAGLHVAP